VVDQINIRSDAENCFESESLSALEIVDS